MAFNYGHKVAIVQGCVLTTRGPGSPSAALGVTTGASNCDANTKISISEVMVMFSFAIFFVPWYSAAKRRRVMQLVG